MEHHKSARCSKGYTLIIHNKPTFNHLSLDTHPKTLGLFKQTLMVVKRYWVKVVSHNKMASLTTTREYGLFVIDHSADW